MDFTDTTQKCKECNAQYVITGGEHRFFTDKGMNVPKRCQPCRDRNRAAREERERNNGGEMSNDDLRRERNKY